MNRGAVPEAARTRALTAESVEERLMKTGGTAYRCDTVVTLVDEGLSLSASAVNALRRDGVPIASNGSGYFYAATDQEVRATIAHLTRRISGIAAAIRGLDRTLEREDTAQTRLPLDGGDTP